MSFKKGALLTGAFIVFLLAALISWYEGGQLRDNPLEWPHTAVFSNWANDGFTHADNLWVLDHFVYAAKFEPLFPLAMVISFFYIVFQLVFWLFEERRTVRNAILLLMAVASFTSCYVLIDSPTTGFKLFSFLFAMVGIGSVFGLFSFKTNKSSAIADKNVKEIDV